MAKTRVVYVCSACGGQSPKWAGQCPDCGAWNSLDETQPVAKVSRLPGYSGEIGLESLAETAAREEPRISTGMRELDRVLGGGLVRGSVTLIGGDPGIGKSTLLLQMMASLSASLPCLYMTGEESVRQIGLRARRLGLQASEMSLLADTSLENLLGHALRTQPGALVVDSIQTLASAELPSAPGSVAQIRHCGAQLVRYAKQSDCAVFLVGHVTKEGNIAGPRVLEHMVDAVLYFENEPGSRFRLIRAVKNRFGTANELGVFAMSVDGLKEVPNPSAMFVSRHEDPVAGSVVMVTREGSRPLLLEIQALVDICQGNYPRRVSVGLEQNRLALLLAVLHRHAGISASDQDVFVNVVGGVRVAETAADLPILLAGVSSIRDRPLPADLVCFGEVGLAGEVRPVAYGEERLAEAAKHGFRRAIVPLKNAPKKPIKGMEIMPVSRLSQAIRAVGLHI